MSGEAKKRGFAALTPERLRELAAEGGRASQASGRGYRWNELTAKAAGKKGGRVSAERRRRHATKEASE